MTNFDKFRRNIYIVMGATTSFLMPFIIDLLQENISSKSTATIIGIAIAVAILIFASFILEDLIDNRSNLRRYISPSSFIEGFWYDITRDNQGNFAHVVILYIEYDQGKYKISGETFNKTSQIAIFNSITSVNFSNNDLLFQTEGNYQKRSTFKSLVSLKFNTPPNKSIPSSYQGFYVDYTSLTLQQIEIGGCRITNKQIEKYSNFKLTSDKLNFVIELATSRII